MTDGEHVTLCAGVKLLQHDDALSLLVNLTELDERLLGEEGAVAYAVELASLANALALTSEEVIDAIETWEWNQEMRDYLLETTNGQCSDEETCDTVRIDDTTPLPRWRADEGTTPLLLLLPASERFVDVLAREWYEVVLRGGKRVELEARLDDLETLTARVRNHLGWMREKLEPRARALRYLEEAAIVVGLMGRRLPPGALPVYKGVQTKQIERVLGAGGFRERLAGLTRLATERLVDELLTRSPEAAARDEAAKDLLAALDDPRLGEWVGEVLELGYLTPAALRRRVARAVGQALSALLLTPLADEALRRHVLPALDAAASQLALGSGLEESGAPPELLEAIAGDYRLGDDRREGTPLASFVEGSKSFGELREQLLEVAKAALPRLVVYMKADDPELLRFAAGTFRFLVWSGALGEREQIDLLSQYLDRAGARPYPMAKLVGRLRKHSDKIVVAWKAWEVIANIAVVAYAFADADDAGDLLERWDELLGGSIGIAKGSVELLGAVRALRYAEEAEALAKRLGIAGYIVAGAAALIEAGTAHDPRKEREAALELMAAMAGLAGVLSGGTAALVLVIVAGAMSGLAWAEEAFTSPTANLVHARLSAFLELDLVDEDERLRDRVEGLLDVLDQVKGDFWPLVTDNDEHPMLRRSLEEELKSMGFAEDAIEGLLED